MSGLLTTDPAVRALTKQSGYWRDLDWILLIAALATTILGSMLVWSASRADMASADDPQSYLKRHVVNIVVGLALGWFASRLDYRWLRAYTPIIYGGSVVLLLMPFVPGIGTTIAGARAWIDLPGGFTLQPSEFAKVAVIMMMAVLLSEKRDIESEPRDRDVIMSLGVALLPVLIILVQNDTGTVLILGSVALSIIAVSGARTRWVVGLIAGAVVGTTHKSTIQSKIPRSVEETQRRRRIEWTTRCIGPRKAATASDGSHKKWITGIEVHSKLGEWSLHVTNRRTYEVSSQRFRKGRVKQV